MFLISKESGDFMSGSDYGKNFTVSTWGESHGKALGVVIDGCPAGIVLGESDIQMALDLRKPGSNAYATKRKESDLCHIMSGTFNGITTGTPISVIIYNEDHHSADYSNIKDIYRPGHADYTFQTKYGIRDYRGGGRSSARETAARVAAGAVAAKILGELGIKITAYAKSIGNIEINYNNFDKDFIYRSPVRMPDKAASGKAEEFIKGCMERQDSCGGVIECVISGVPAGIGEPVFNKLDAELSKAIMSVGAVKGIEFGSGFSAARSTGSINNDNFINDKGIFKKLTNNAGGILGGISDGSDIIFRAAIKPTPSISQPQKTIDISGNETEIVIKGRHDPIIVPRAVPVIEAMSAIALTDLMFSAMLSQMSKIKAFWL